jgi:hypothetical protein
MREPAKFKGDGTLRRRKELGHYCRGRRHDITYNHLFFMSDIQHCFICRPSDSTVSEDAGIEPRTVASSALAVRRSNHSAGSHIRLKDIIVLQKRRRDISTQEDDGSKRDMAAKIVDETLLQR